MELLAILASDPDPNIAERAGGVLLTQPTEAFLAGLARPDAPPALFSYCAANLASQPGVADALARNEACPAKTLARITPHLSVSGVQALFDNLERLITAPALVEALSTSTSLTIEQRDMLQEMQTSGAGSKELEEAIAEAEPDSARRQTLLQRLARMTVIERMLLALRGNREERMVLIRDPNRMVQRAVLQSPRLTDQEIESFAAMSSVTSEVLRVIGASRVFLKNYTVVRHLLGNSKTPLETTLHLLPRLTLQDLKLLTMNKNIPQVLRTTAIKLYRQRSVK